MDEGKEGAGLAERVVEGIERRPVSAKPVKRVGCPKIAVDTGLQVALQSVGKPCGPCKFW